MRKKTGTIVKTKLGLWQAVITLADGTRKRLPPFPKGTSEAMAREKAAYFAERAATMAITKQPTDEGERWWADYHQHRVDRGLLSVEGIFRKHLWPACPKHPRDVTVKDCEAVRDSLDRKIHKGEIAAKSALNTWTVWTTAMKAAAGTWKRDKPRRFKVRDDDPCQGVAPPDEPQGEKELQWLYPAEYARLVACEEVPIERRVRYVLAVNLFARGGELAALTWGDVNLTNGVVSIRHSYNQELKVVKGTKTGNEGNRKVTLDPSMRALFAALYERSGGTGTVITMPLRHYWADQLRADLERAGVTRAALFADTADETRRRLRFHDLRSSGLTWLAIQGVDAHKIQQRAGHSTFEMTQKYLRAAEVAGTDIGTPFPPLPSEFIDHLKRSPEAQVGETIVGRLGLEHGRDGLNRGIRRRIPGVEEGADPGTAGAKSAKARQAIERSDHQIGSLVTGASPLFRLLELAGQAPRAALPALGAELERLVSPGKAVAS